MQTTQNPQQAPTSNPTNPAQQESGFQPIPTRMQDLAPLVVAPEDAETHAAVSEQLEALEGQLANVHAIASEAYSNQGDYERALVHMEMTVKLDSDNMQQLNQVGFLRYLTGDDDGAIAAFETVVEQIPDQVDALNNLGMVYFGREQYPIAKQWFVRALKQTPEDAELWNNCGACVYQSGDAAEAGAYFRKALEIDPNNEDAKANLAAC